MPWAMGTSSMTSKLTGEGGRMWMSKEMSERQTKAGNQITLSLSHSLTLVRLKNFCFHVYARKSLTHSHSHTFSLSQCLTLALSLFHSLIT